MSEHKSHRKDSTGYYLMTDDMALQMIREDIRSLKDDQREDFNRLNGKIDDFKDDMNVALGAHDKDITKLTTQASMAGRVAGTISGAAVSIVIYVTVAIVRHQFGI